MVNAFQKKQPPLLKPAASFAAGGRLSVPALHFTVSACAPCAPIGPSARWMKKRDLHFFQCADYIKGRDEKFPPLMKKSGVGYESAYSTVPPCLRSGKRPPLVSPVTGGPGPVIPGGSGVVRPPFHPGRFQPSAPLSAGGYTGGSSPSQPILTSSLYHQAAELSRGRMRFPFYLSC